MIRQLAHLLLHAKIGLLKQPHLLLRDLSKNTHAKPGPGKRLTVEKFVRHAENPSDRADFVLEEISERLDELKLQIIRKSADIMVRLDRLGRALHLVRALDDIGIDRALPQKPAVTEPAGLLRKDVDECLSDRLALRLRIFESLERTVEPLRRTDDGEVETEVASEHRLDLLGFAPAEQSVVDEDAMESRADRPVKQHRGDGRVDSAGKWEIGKWLSEGNAVKKDSLIQTCYECGVPIFVPAFSDCSAGFGIGKHQWENPEKHMSIDSVADFIELTKIKMAAGTTGLFMVGGGSPKNFAQDTVVCAEILGFEVPMHKYAVQITVADVRDGACSSSTLKEAGSWGKVDNSFEQMVYAEGTTVIPAIASYVYHNGPWKEREYKNWNKEIFGKDVK